MFSSTSAVPTMQTPSVVKPIPTKCDFDNLRRKNIAESILVEIIMDPEKNQEWLYSKSEYCYGPKPFVQVNCCLRDWCTCVSKLPVNQLINSCI